MQRKSRFTLLLCLVCWISLSICYGETTRRETQEVKPMKSEPVVNPEHEIRALWVTRMNYKTADDVNKIITNAYNYNFNLILFQVRGNATVFYKSKYEPWAWELTSTSTSTTSTAEAVKSLGKDPGWDPLATAIDTAHALGLELHAYMNTFPAWKETVPPPENVNQLWNTHRDWFMQDSAGNVMWPQDWWSYWYTFIDPGVPEVQEYLTNIYLEVVQNYDVDGIHYDYIRYPGEVGDWSFNPISVKRFTETYGDSPHKLPALWNEWKRTQITELVRRIYRAVNQVKPGRITVSGSVAGTWDNGYTKYFQDRRTWLAQGIIDMTNPMCYVTTYSIFSAEVDEHLKNSFGRFVCPGIGVHRTMTPDQLLEQVELVRKLGAPGITFFAYNNLFPKHQPNKLAQALLTGPFSRKAVIPPMPWKQTTRSIKSQERQEGN
ncbi:MAG: family 10 glycosylhydrolase [bacterium]|nr:family 10 glycosylhydrolase [bacterium]